MGSPSKPLKSCNSLNSDCVSEDKEIPEYEPINFLRCHSGDRLALKRGFSLDEPCDDVTNVWACAFEPHPSETGCTTGRVATCGGSLVCLIDVSSGKVMKRWERGKEQFFCLAWTTLVINGNSTNVLAVSGHNGMLKLLCPSQLLCYHEHGNGRPNKQVIEFYYSFLKFHPSIKTWLFCSSSDSTITLFDIGIPQGPDMNTVVKRLSVFNSQPVASISVTLYLEACDWLLAATVGGLMVWEGGAKNINNKKKTPIKVVKLDSKVKSVDALSLLSHQRLAVKYIGHAFIVIYNLTQLNVLYSLTWIKTSIDYIGMTANKDFLICGTNKGDIMLYDTTPSRQPSTAHTLVWPYCQIDDNHPDDSKMKDLLQNDTERVINSICVDGNGDYIVAVTDCNIVCVWRKITNKQRLG